MKIAQVAPLAESVPPALYGGTERVVSVLTEELVRRGHDVTLFASADSKTAARLVPCAPRSLRLDPSVKDTVAPTLIELGEVYSRAGEFDVIHNHVDYFAFPFARLTRTPTVTTTHGRLDLMEVHRAYDQFREQKLVSISHDQATRLPHANWIGHIHNAIEVANFEYRDKPGDYLIFLGRISPEKRPDRAIEIARAVGMRIIIAAKVDSLDRDYYQTAIKPMVDASRLVEFVGEVDEAAKNELLGRAYASLFPIDWPEPFGLTMVESMATGTPVIAARCGSVPEVMIDGVTGFICESLREMIEAVDKVRELDRARCREHVELEFAPRMMASAYEKVYESILAGKPTSPAKPARIPLILPAGKTVPVPGDWAKAG